MTYHSRIPIYSCFNCEELFFPLRDGEECPRCNTPNSYIDRSIVEETLLAAMLHKTDPQDMEEGYILPLAYGTFNLADLYIYNGLLALNRFHGGNSVEEFARRMWHGALPEEKEHMEDHLVRFITDVLNRISEIEPFERRH